MKNKPPYYAVIFTSTRTTIDDGYSAMAQRMDELAKKQSGYLGFDTANGDRNISVSYWESLEAIAVWRKQAAHVFAQEKGKDEWYSWYKVRICKVMQEYDFDS
jgi:heme-degrading monooxygenase HmoA